MTKLWAKMMDIDGDGNLEVVQTHDEDPVNLWHPDALVHWREVPSHVDIGFVLETATNVWWAGSDWLEKTLAKADESDAPPLETAPFKGSVTKIKIKEAGANYEIPFVRNQYDTETGEKLIVIVTYDETTESATSVEIVDSGFNYEVGQTFRITEGYGRDWDRKNPTFTVIEIEEVYNAPDAVVRTPPTEA
jgi:hypothetical protein